MKLLANKNFPADSFYYLKAKGFDVKSVGIDYAGITDEEVMHLAMEENRTILTFDKDYGELIFKHGYRPDGVVIFLRLDAYESDEPGKIIEQMLGNEHLHTERKLTVYDGKFIRQRPY